MTRKTAYSSILWLACAFGIQPLSAEDSHGYLALGDSLAFGFSPLVVPVDLKKYHGYPEIVADQIDGKLANASCFGETSQHFLNLAGEDLGCSGWRAAYPLFVSYSGTQMDYAVQYLKSHPTTGLVTIDIGINDLGVLLRDCLGNIACALAGFPNVLTAYQDHLTTIYTRIRVEAGYKGPLVAVTAYAVNYTDPVQTPAIATLDGVLSAVTAAFGGKVADAFAAFGAAAATHSGDVCPTGLLVKLPNNTCDTHPSAKGQALIADLILELLAKGDEQGGGDQGNNDNQGDH
jgi:lysophospholipase L1-like esterase